MLATGRGIVDNDFSITVIKKLLDNILNLYEILRVIGVDTMYVVKQITIANIMKATHANK